MMTLWMVDQEVMDHEFPFFFPFSFFFSPIIFSYPLSFLYTCSVPFRFLKKRLH